MKLTDMKNVDIRTVERKDLVDIKKIQAETETEGCDEADLTVRISEFIRQTGNPYCYMVGKVIVKSTFTEGVSINQRFKEMIMSR